LPDKFIFRLYKDSKTFINAVGNPVDHSIILGINHKQGANAGIDWLYDFGKAVEAGMGIKIPLSPEYQNGFSMLVVTGIKAAADSTASQRLLENLFENHFYSNNGLALVKQGTLTNNSDDEDAGYSWKDRYKKQDDLGESTPHTIATNTEQGSMAFNDGEWLSQYLGIDDGIFQKVENGKGSDQADARAMNVSLFPATLGYYLDEMLDPLLSSEEISSVERFFTKYVLGRGTIPSLRIGKQPYGILPASVLAKLDLKANDAIRNKIADKANGLFEFWRQKSQTVKHIDGSAPINNEDFLQILSLHPASINFSQRLFEDIGFRLNAANSSLIDSAIFGDLNEWIEEVYVPALFPEQRLAEVGLDPLVDRPDILFKLFQEKAVALNGPVIEKALDEFGLVLEETFSEADGLRFNYIQWLVDSDVEAIRSEKGFNVAQKPLLFLFLRHAYLTKFAKTALQLKTASSRVASDSIKKSYKDNQKLDSTNNSKMALLYQTDKRITQSATLALKDFIYRKLTLDEVSPPIDILALRDHRTNLSKLSQLSKAALERAFVEHLDCCTYRIDAWINGLFSVQVRKQRLQSQAKNQWSKGIYLGAFGYVENLKPKDPNASEGYILGPSQAHAAAGAVLKNAQLTYGGNDANPFNINVSAERIRTARRILEGIRNGQGLPELLGYRFERELHDAQLDKFILDFRKQYPLPQVTQSESASPIEVIAAVNVANGKSLLADFESRGKAILGTLGRIANGEKTRLIAALDRLNNIFDSIKDIMITEGVFQTVKGNFERGQAMLDSLSKGKYVPEVEVIRTPRSGPRLTQRVALHFSKVEACPVSKGSRAILEPSLNAWLKTILPDTASIVAGVRFSQNDAPTYVSLQDLKVEPIDLLYLLNDNDQAAMSALDDLILAYLADQNPGELGAYFSLDLNTIHFKLVDYSLKPDASQFSFFEIRALIRPLRRCLFEAHGYLTANALVHDSSSPIAQTTKVSGYHKTRLNALVEAIGRLDFSFADDWETAPLTEIRRETAAFILKASPLIWMQTSFGSIFEKLFYAGTDPARIGQIRKDARKLVAAVKEKADFLTAKLREMAPLFAPLEEFRVFHEKLKEICGDDVLVLPDFTLPAGATPEDTALIAEEIQDALKKSPDLLKFSKDKLPMDFPVEEWLAGVARVREKMAAVLELNEYLEVQNGQGLGLTPIQLPENKEGRWLALQYASEGEEIKIKDTLLYTFLGPGQDALDKGLCGFLVDEWTEQIPNKEETAGIAFHYNRPNAEAPQTMLLCTPPAIKGNWDIEDVFESIKATMELAKARAVEPDHLDDTVLAQFLPATILFSPLYDTSVATNLAENLK
jgi:hypothetical protein